MMRMFFAIRKKAKFLLRLIILIILLFLAITAIVYQAIMSIIFFNLTTRRVRYGTFFT